MQMKGTYLFQVEIFLWIYNIAGKNGVQNVHFPPPYSDLIGYFKSIKFKMKGSLKKAEKCQTRAFFFFNLIFLIYFKPNFRQMFK